MNTCPFCGADAGDRRAFCGKCGGKIQQRVAVIANVVVGREQASDAATKLNGTERKRQFCGQCGSASLPDGSCPNCAVRPLASGSLKLSNVAPRGPAPIPVSTAPLSPRAKRMMVLATAGFVAAGLAFTAIKAVWGDSLRIQSQPGGATVLVDGEEKGRTSAEGILKVDHLHGQIHTVTVKADGYIECVRQVRFPLPAEAPLRVSLYPKPAELHLQGLPGSAVLLNSGFAGRINYAGTWDLIGMRAGTYAISLRCPGYLEWTDTVTLKPGESQTVQGRQAQAPPSPEELAIKAETLITGARRKFGATDYDGAQKDCEAASALQHDNAEAKQLCDQIQAAKDVLKGVR